MRAEKIAVVDLPVEQIEKALAQAKPLLPEGVYGILDAVVRAYLTVVQILQKKSVTIRRLRRMLFGPTSEKTQQVLGSQAHNGAEQKAQRGDAQTKGDSQGPKRPPPGHGRMGQDAYWGADKREVPHQKLKHGDRCPECGKGNVYDQPQPGILVRVTGQAPLAMTVWQLQRLRCGTCGKSYEAKPPPGVGRRKYDEKAAAMIAYLRYGNGLAHNRIAKVQRGVGMPVPPSNQWEIVRDAAKQMEPAYEELMEQAAQGEVVHNDDTPMRIQAWMGKNRQNHPGLARGNGANASQEKDRTGIFTTGIISRVKLGDALRVAIALFFTGWRHAGENLTAVLGRRKGSLSSPVQMCEGLSRNLPKQLRTILANCLAHGRRKVVELVANFPPQCEYILRGLGEVYRNDAVSKKRKMTDAQRLKYHQHKSGPVMEKLRGWMSEQLEQKKVEPNSGLGEAMGYLLEHWEKLTLFLRVPGAPLDNNICERALKKAIVHRKNSLFYKTPNGARVGDLYMALIHTCELNGVDAFDYLTQLQVHAKEVRADPKNWMPWNYRRGRSREPPR